MKAFWTIAAALGLAQASAVMGQAPASAEGTAGAGSAKAVPGGISKEQAAKILEECGSRRFQTSAEFTVEGKQRRTGLQMCSKPGETDQEWIARLEKAIISIEAQASLPAEAKARIVGDVRGEVRRLKSLQRRALPAADALVSNVPPLPAPLPPAATAIGPSVLARSLLDAPQLSFRCLESGEQGDGWDCNELRENTVLVVKADANMKAPATLRFVRRGEARGEVQLGQMRKGQLVKLRIPANVCKGVVRSQVAIEIMSDSPTSSPLAQAAATKGPYQIRC